MNQPSFFASCVFVVLEMWSLFLASTENLYRVSHFLVCVDSGAQSTVFLIIDTDPKTVLQVSLLRRIVTPTIRVHYSVLTTYV